MGDLVINQEVQDYLSLVNTHPHKWAVNMFEMLTPERKR